MKRKLAFVAMCLGLAVAAVIVVLATRQDTPTVNTQAAHTTSGSPLTFEQSGRFPQMTVVAPMLKSNSIPHTP